MLWDWIPLIMRAVNVLAAGGLVMNTRVRNLIIIFAVSLILVGCTGSSTLKRGWVETSGLSHRNVRYNYFDGTERQTIRAKKGADIDLKAEVDVDDGTLAVRLLDPRGDMIWEEVYREDAQFSFSVEAEENGRYKLLVEGETAEGGFEIDWEVKD
jgi:hypothetical protein